MQRNPRFHGMLTVDLWCAVTKFMNSDAIRWGLRVWYLEISHSRSIHIDICRSHVAGSIHT